MMEIKTIKDIAKFIRTGKTPPSQEVKYFDGEVNWYTPGDLDKGKYLSTSKRTLTNLALEDKKAVVFPKNTLIVGCIGDIGKLGITIDDCSSNQQLTGIYPNDNVDVNYLYYWFKGNKSLIDSYANNAVVPILNNRTLETIKLPIPPLPQQQKIANILDSADALRQNDKALIAKYDELTQALFLDMFGEPGRNEKGWEKLEFSKVAKNENSKRVPVKQSDRDKREGEYSYYGATGIIDTIDDYKFDGEFLLIAEDGKNLLFRKKNNAFIANGKFWVNNHAHVLSSNGVTDLKYLEFFLNNIDFGPYISGIDQIKLNKENLNKIPVPVPPLKLQNQFTERVKVIEEQKAIAQKSLEKSEELFNSLLQMAFKGELA